MIVCCIKVGDKYSVDYVHRLEAMCRRHTTRPFQFLCLTDDFTGLNCERAAKIGTDLPGWWSKLILFQPHFAIRNQRTLFLDLDTIIIGNIDRLMDYDGPFAILQDFWAPTYNSSVMSFVGSYGPQIWEQFDRRIISNLWGDQDWITTCVRDADIWQGIAPGYIASYKADRLEKSPGDYRVVCFHGDPKPHTLKGWVKDAWI